MFKSSFLKEVEARGMIKQCTDFAELDSLMNEKKITAYIGFDPTADSLHVGNAMSLMMLRLLRKHGHSAIALVGGATAKIGDPSFRDTARSLMSEDTIKHNLAGITKSIKKFTDDSVVILNNDDWLSKVGWLELLRDVGPQFSVSRMVALDSVKDRLEREQGLSFLEFNYSILQSFDFRHLNREHDCVLQIGGSDQWGNIVSGIDLVRRTDEKKVFGLTTPLVETSDGKKMGKSANGAVWVNEDKLSVFDFWQFWRNVHDDDVCKFMKLFTDIDPNECDKICSGDINQAKIRLATEATSICHGADKAKEAEEAAKKIFSEKSDVANLEQIDVTAESNNVVDVFIAAGLFSSKSEARRMIKNRGCKINNEVVESADDSMDAGSHMLSVGKKKHININLIYTGCQNC